MTRIVTDADSVFEVFLTVMVAVPTAFALTFPEAETVNTEGSLLINSTLSLALIGVFEMVNCCKAEISIVVEAAVIVND
jgi:hypothetical membrane protein